MDKNRDDIIRKLFERSLEPKERGELNNYEFINDALRKQWEEAPAIVDSVREERILHSVLKNVKRKTNYFTYSFYRYGIAVSVAICMLLSALLFVESGRQEVIYVVNTGYQSMDSVKLADGTKVMLGAGSKLTYPQKFSGSNREVKLSGQAFFNVSPDKSHPFIVKTKKMDVTVMGTSFEIFSYDNDKEVEAVLLTGKVKVAISDNKKLEGKIYTLAPNEKLTYSEEKGVNLTNIDADAYSGWRKGKRMSFKNETLQIILNRLEKWYGQRIECDPQLAEYYRFTFTVHSEPLALILNYISHSAPLTYKMVGNNHYLIELKH